MSIPSSTRAGLQRKQKAEATTKNTNPNPPFATTLPLSQLCTAGSLLRPLSFAPALGERRKERDDDDPRQIIQKSSFSKFHSQGLFHYVTNLSAKSIFIQILHSSSQQAVILIHYRRLNKRSSFCSFVSPSVHPSPFFIHVLHLSAFILHPHPFPSPQQTSVLQFVRPSVHPQSSSIFFHRFTFIFLFFRACSLTSLFNKLSYSRDLSLNGVFLMREKR